MAGFTSREILQIIIKLTQLLSMDVKQSLAPTLNYLLNKIGLTKKNIISNPAVLSLSLYKRIIPRYQTFLKRVSVYISFRVRYLIINEVEFNNILLKKTRVFYQLNNNQI